MPGLGSEPAGSVNAGIGAQPLVTSANPVVNPSAVQALSDAFRQGVLTTDDILNRLGPAGQARRKAEITSLNEFSGPNATAARQAAYQAAAAKSGLETQQATAAGPLVEPGAALQGAQIARQQADLKWAGGVQAYQQYAPYFGQPAIVQKEDGSPDYDTMGQKGNEYMRTMAQQNFARMMLEPDPNRKISGVNNQQQPFERQYNKWGVEVTPGSPTYNNLSQVIQSTNDTIFGTPGKVSVQPTAPPPPAVSPTPSMSGDAARAAILNANPNLAGSAVANLPDAQAQAAATPQVTPQVAPQVTPPVVEPGGYSPGTGLITGPSKNQFTAESLGADLRKQKSYELWDQQKGFAQSFETTADKINKIPVAEQRSSKAKMNTLDIALAESIIKMYDPGMAIREFKWDKLAEAQPLLEKLPNWKAEFLKTGSLTPEGRQRLIEMGYDNINGKDAAVLPHIQLAAQRAQGAGLKPSDVLNADELRVLNQKAFGHPPGSSPAAASPEGKTVTIPGLGTGVFDPKSGIFTRTQ